MVSFIQEDYVRCVLPDLALPLGKNGDYLVNHFKDKYDINIEYLEQTSTKSGKGPKSSRIDQIFNVKNYRLDKYNQNNNIKNDSIEKYKKIKDKKSALYVTEIVKNNEHHIYKERIYLTYFKSAEKKLVKSGELSKENIYQSVFEKLVNLFFNHIMGIIFIFNVYYIYLTFNS